MDFHSSTAVSSCIHCHFPLPLCVWPPTPSAAVDSGRTPRCRSRLTLLLGAFLPSGLRFLIFARARTPSGIRLPRTSTLTRTETIRRDTRPSVAGLAEHSLYGTFPDLSCAGVAAMIPRTAWTTDRCTGPLWGMQLYDVTHLRRHHGCHRGCCRRPTRRLFLLSSIFTMISSLDTVVPLSSGVWMQECFGCVAPRNVSSHTPRRGGCTDYRG